MINNREGLLKKVFERSKNPVAQLNRINNIVPAFFADLDTIEAANKRLEERGLKINGEYLSRILSQTLMFGHPSCGPSNDSGYGHPSCGPSKDSGYGHPSCGPSRKDGYGHPSCLSSKNREKTNFIVRR